jgi:hypothetical protein
MDDAKPPLILPLNAVTALAAAFSHFSDIGYIYLRKARLIPFLTCVRDVHLISWNSNEPETDFRSTPPLRSHTHVGVLYFSFLHRVRAPAADECGDPNEKITSACKNHMPAPWRPLGRGDSQSHVFMRLKVKTPSILHGSHPPLLHYMVFI